jgi:hypothetical protein
VSLLGWTLLSFAWAEGPPPGWTDISVTAPPEVAETPVTAVEGVPLSPVSEDPYEIVVWGELAIRQARSDLVRSMEELGWRAAGPGRDGDLVFRPPRSWMGRGRFTREGSLIFGRPVLAFGGVAASPTADASDGALDRTYASGSTQAKLWVLPARRLTDRVQAAVADQVAPQVEAYQAILRASRFQDALALLPQRLDALWRSGDPLVPGVTLETPEQRRAAVLDLWATRGDTPEGLEIAEAIETWLRETVQPTAHPVTPAERVEAEERRHDARRLDLG